MSESVQILGAGHIVYDDSLERGRWEKQPDGRRIWRGPRPVPGQVYVLSLDE